MLMANARYSKKMPSLPPGSSGETADLGQFALSRFELGGGLAQTAELVSRAR